MFLLRLCENFSDEYYITLVVIDARNGLAEEFEKQKIEVIYLGCSSILHFPIALLRMRKMIKQLQPNLIHTFLYYADILVGVAKLGIRIPLVWSIRGASLAVGSKKYKFLIQKLAGLLSRLLPDLIISCGRTASDFHKKIGYPGKKIIEIGNFPAKWVIDALSNSVFKTQHLPSSFRIGLAARYDLGKGHLKLLQGLCSFIETEDNLDLVTVVFSGKGCHKDGPLDRELMSTALVKKLVTCNKLVLEFHGQIYGVELKNWFESLDVYFMASDASEGFPNSLAEALTIGLPSLSTPQGESINFLPAEFITSGTDPKDLCQSMRSFYHLKPVEVDTYFSKIKEKMEHNYSELGIKARYRNSWDSVL
jgi:glycosyltransferase involved in cell wall biosynthesis